MSNVKGRVFLYLVEKYLRINKNEIHLTFKLVYSRLKWCSGKESFCNARSTRDMSSVPGSGRFPGGGNERLFQCSCLENYMNRGAWHATVHGVCIGHY